jgi:hypothetical protein
MSEEPTAYPLSETLRLVYAALEKDSVAAKADPWDEIPAFEKREDGLPENNRPHGTLGASDV